MSAPSEASDPLIRGLMVGGRLCVIGFVADADSYTPLMREACRRTAAANPDVPVLIADVLVCSENVRSMGIGKLPTAVIYWFGREADRQTGRAALHIDMRLEMVLQSPHWTGRAAFEEGWYEKAVETLADAIEQNPRDRAAWSYRAQALSNLGRYEDALAVLEEASTIFPSSSSLWIARGEIHRHEEEIGQALKCYEKAGSLRPDNAAAFYGVAQMLCMLRTYGRGLKMLRKAVTLDPELKRRARRDQAFRDLRRDGDFIGMTRESS